MKKFLSLVLLVSSLCLQSAETSISLSGVAKDLNETLDALGVKKDAYVDLTLSKESIVSLRKEINIYLKQTTDKIIKPNFTDNPSKQILKNQILSSQNISAVSIKNSTPIRILVDIAPYVKTVLIMDNSTGTITFSDIQFKVESEYIKVDDTVREKYKDKLIGDPNFGKDPGRAESI